MYDLVIKNGLIVTMDKKRRVFHGDIGIESNEIAFVGEELRSDLCGSDTKVIDASGKIVLPGFINTHVHTPMGLWRGLGDDLDCLNIHKNVTYPLGPLTKKEEVYLAALLCCIEMLKGGTTTFLDNQYLLADPENTSMVCKAVAEVGLRGNIAFGLQDDPIAPTRWSSISECESMLDYLLETWHHKENDRIKIWLHPVIPGVWETPEMCKQARIWADKYGLRITTHLGDTWDRVKTVQERYGDKNITLFCERTGLLGEDVVMAHCQWITKDEIDLLRETDTRASHMAAFNLCEGDLVAPIIRMMRSGIKVGLGTDAPTSSNNADMLECMKFAALVHKGHHLDPQIISGERVLEMATIEGAMVIGQDDEIGSLEVGKKADITLVNWQQPHMVPLYRPVSVLVYCANAGDVDTVIVDGRVLMEERKVLTIDEKEVLKKAQEKAEKLVQKAGNQEVAYRDWLSLPKINY